MPPPFPLRRIASWSFCLTAALAGLGLTHADDAPNPESKEAASVFAARVQRGISLLARRYVRELDEDEMIAWAVQGLYAVADAKLPKDLEDRIALRLGASAKKGGKIDLSKQIDGALELLRGPTTPEQRTQLLTEARLRLGDRNTFSDYRDVELALKHVTSRLDGNTIVMSSAAVQRMRAQQFASNLGEIGLVLARRPGNGAIVVAAVLKDSPAHKAGFRIDDEVVGLATADGGAGMPAGELKSIDLPTLDDEGFEKVLWGGVGTRVQAMVRRAERFLTFDLTRAQVKRESIVGVDRRPDETWNHVIDEERNIAYVRLLNYQRADLASDLERLLATFDDRKMRGLILDLRFTGPGLIDTGVAAAELFVDEGLIVEFRWRADGSGKRTANRKNRRADFPIACLVNGSAGTCTEFVAACLQDHRRAVIVGERTSGRASLQNYFPFDGGTLRITTSHAYRPSGKPLDRAEAEAAKRDDWGVTPDVAVELAKEERNALHGELRKRTLLHADALRLHGPEGEDRQLRAALDSLVRKLDARSVP